MSAVSADPPKASSPILRHQVPLHSERRRHPRRRLQLDLVPLPVIEGERVAGVSIAPRQRQAGGRIEASAQQAHGFSRWSDEDQLPL